MKKALFVRHGEAQANVDGVLAGAATDTPLTAKGRGQAVDIARRLVMSDIRPEIVASSLLMRAYETASIIAMELQLGVDVVKNDLSVERDFGKATNLPRAQAFALLDSGNDVGAESVQALGRRARIAKQWLAQQSAATILIVSHAAFGQMLGAVASGYDDEEFLQFQDLHNGGWFEICL